MITGPGTVGDVADVGGPRALSPRRALLLTGAIVLVAGNLRPGVASVGPVLEDLRQDLGLSGTEASLVTALPVLCFGLLATVAPRLARRGGLEPVLAGVLLAIAAGLAVRVAGGLAVLLVGTVVACGAMAIGNVLVPALVKRDFPHRTGRLTGLYTMAISGSAAVAAALTVPAAQLLPGGWRAGLAVWAVPAVVALAVWWPFVRSRTPPPPDPPSPPRLLGNALAWQVTAFFGLQSLGFYSVLAWLPSVFRSAGFDPATAGVLLSVATVLGAPVALVVPALATRTADQRWLAVAATTTTAVGYVGLIAAPSAAPYLWAVLIGLGHGASFPLALTLLVLRTRSGASAASLSAMAQSIGYAFAATGPLMVGALFDLTGSWDPAVGVLLVLLLPQTVTGVLAGRDRAVEDVSTSRQGS